MYFKEVDFDAAIRYKTNDPAETLPEICRNYSVIYFDNAYRKTLESVSNNANTFSKIACCDMMCKGNCEKPEPARNLFRITNKIFEVCGFIVGSSRKMKGSFGK